MPVPASQSTNAACQALQELQRQLIHLAGFGGGDVTPGLLQAAADNCPEAVIVSDREAQIVMVNGMAARLVGLSTRDLQKLTIWDITHATFQADFDILWKEFLRAGRQRGEYALKHKENGIVEVAYCAQANVLADKNIIVLRRTKPS